MKRIQVWSYLTEYEEMRETILSAVDDVFNSGQLILGKRVSALEAQIANYIGVSETGIGVNSGTDALHIGLKALGIGPGDEVITVANTAVPTVAAIVSTGAIPKFVDIDSKTYLMDCNQIPKIITPATACILPVHLYGQCVDMVLINDIAKQHKLAVLEDCAQSMGATFNNQKSGKIGDIGAFSFYPTKLLGAYGDGGMILTNSTSLQEKCRRLRMYGMDGNYYSEEHGYNSRLDEVQAAILSIKLKSLNKMILRRRKIASQYTEKLKDTDLVLPVEAPLNQHVFYLYVVRHPERDRIINALAKKNIHLNISYPYPISLMRGYSYLGYKEGDLPVTENLAKEIFSLPMYPSLTDEEQDFVCDVLRGILK
ncbi:MAG: DegT/DnrJ/EryC1/StrS family aminotransferase [Pseudomonadota bacterium]|nr:DegT/DnrJ/EryC1/StrS family aminotransferase [Pseudomonadota bacterium]